MTSGNSELCHNDIPSKITRIKDTYKPVIHDVIYNTCMDINEQTVIDT